MPKPKELQLEIESLKRTNAQLQVVIETYRARLNVKDWLVTMLEEKIVQLVTQQHEREGSTVQTTQQGAESDL